MSEKINDGGAAFPDPGRAQSEKQREKLTEMGMTLRDYFAAKAMDHFIDLCTTDIWNQGQGLESLGDPALQAAKSAYRMADAMLMAREAK